MPGMKEALAGAVVIGMVGLGVGAKGAADTKFATSQQITQSTPRPSEAGDTPKITETECPFENKQIEPGKPTDLPPTTIVTGNIFVNDQRMFDENDRTSLVTVLPQGGNVSTNEGAFAVCAGENPKVQEQIIGQKIVEQAEKGCNSGPCEWVYVKYGVPGKDGHYGKKKHDGKPPSQPPPEETPPPEAPPTGKG